MSQFLGSHQNRLDAKGRISVPAGFRLALKNADDAELILRPSHKYACIEAWPGAVFSALAKPLDSLDLFSEAHDDMAATLYSDAYRVETDKEGRILLPDAMVAHARLSGAVVFLGLGRIFQIWQPEAAEIFRAASRERARARGLTLPGTGA